MTTPSTPTWYDVLGVSRHASPEEIKAAWRTSTDRFEPGSGSGQFRMFNEAADVLLDPVSRAAYDASLDADRPQQSPALEPEPELAAPPVTETTPPPPPPPAAVEDTEAKRSNGIWIAVLATLGGLNLITLAVLAVLTVGVLTATAITGVKVNDQANVIDARQQAPAAAESAAKALFSYDYRHLDADRDRAANYVTDSFGKDYLKNFTQLEKQKDGTPGLAVQSKTVVTADVVGSGVVDAEDGVARVLVYVDQTSKKASGQPQIFQNRVAMTMKQVGDKWLVDDVKSY
jgi:Mce-associated membrane protein